MEQNEVGVLAVIWLTNQIIETKKNSVWWFKIAGVAVHVHQINRIIANSLLCFVLYQHSLKHKGKFLPKCYKFSHLQTFLVTNLERLLGILGSVPRNSV